jgi:hypothetical protein
MKDEEFSVHIRGYGYNELSQTLYGVNGTSKSFLVTVVPPPVIVVVETASKPVFSEFP